MEKTENTVDSALMGVVYDSLVDTEDGEQAWILAWRPFGGGGVLGNMLNKQSCVLQCDMRSLWFAVLVLFVAIGAFVELESAYLALRKFLLHRSSGC